MKWIALSLIALGALLFADHRNGGVPVGLGVILLGYWYFVEREPSEPSQVELEDGQQDGADEPLVESSTSFDPSDIRPFLEQLQPHFSGGFGERVVAHISDLAARMKHNEERSLEYVVTYCGKPRPLKIGLFRDDIEEITAYFHSPQPVADLIDSEMESFFAARDM